MRDGWPSVLRPASPPADSLTTPIVQTATYTFQDTAELIAYQEGRYGSYEYGRYGNPTTRACEEKIRELEGAEDCLVSSSGMNAATTVGGCAAPAGRQGQAGRRRYAWAAGAGALAAWSSGGGAEAGAGCADWPGTLCRPR